MVIPFVCFRFDSLKATRWHSRKVQCNRNDRCSLYPSLDSIWIELCPANWREAFKADTLSREGAWFWFSTNGLGVNGKYRATALNDRTVIETYSECLSKHRHFRQYHSVTLSGGVCVRTCRFMCVFISCPPSSLVWFNPSLCFSSVITPLVVKKNQ